MTDLSVYMLLLESTAERRTDNYQVARGKFTFTSFLF